MKHFPLPTIDDDADRWSRVAFLARLIEMERADLDDEPDCWRALYRWGIPPSEAEELTPDAIRHIREFPAPALH